MLKNNNALLINFDELIKNPKILNDSIYTKFGIKSGLDIPSDYYFNYMSIVHPDNHPKVEDLEKKMLIDEIKKSSEYKSARRVYKNILKRTSSEF
jgi:hypothetical protein